MQEQSSEKTVGLAVQTSKMTGRVLIRAFEKYLYHRKELNRDRKYAERTDPSKNPINQVKRVKVKNLVKEGSPLSTVELRDANIRQFDRLAKANVSPRRRRGVACVATGYDIIFFKGIN